MSPSKSNAWSVRTEEGVAGPFTIEQLRVMVKRGTLDRHSLIRAEGSVTWMRAGQIPVIFEATATTETATSSSPSIKTSATPPPMRAPLRTQSIHTQLNGTFLIPVIATVLALSMLAGSVYWISRTGDNALANQKSNSDGKAMPPDSKSLKTSNATSTEHKSTKPTSGELSSSEPALSSSDLGTSSATANVDENTAPKKESAKNRKPSDYDTDTNGPYSTEKIVALTEHAVVTVLAGDGVGSGFVVAPNIVATNYHVIADDDGEHVSCVFPASVQDKRKLYPAKLVSEDPRADLALLRINCDVEPIVLADNTSFRRGQDVIAIGTPALFDGHDILPNAITRGVVSSQHNLFGEPRYQLSMAVNPGNSGGPVIGLDAKVVGVVVSKSRSEEGIAFCVPVASLRRLMDEHKADNFAVNKSVRSQHLARVTARELVVLTLDLEKFLVQLAKVVEAKTGEDARQLPADIFAEILNNVITEINPGIRKDFSSQLRQIAADDNLSPRVRSELKTLEQRHLSLHAAIARPTGNVRSMISTIGNLRDRFLEQLRKVDKLLPLGFPELVEEHP